MRRHGYITEEEQKLANSIPVASLTKDASGNSTSNGVSPYQSYIDTVVKELDKNMQYNGVTGEASNSVSYNNGLAQNLQA